MAAPKIERPLPLVAADEIPVLVHDCAVRMRKPVHGLTPGAERVPLSAFLEASVRELAGAFDPVRQSSSPPRGRTAGLAGRGVEPPASLAEIEREHILGVLRQVNGNRMAAAKLLGISRRALYRRIDRHQLADKAPRPAARRYI